MGGYLVEVRDEARDNGARLLSYFLARQHRLRGALLLELGKCQDTGDAAKTGAGSSNGLSWPRAARLGGGQLLDLAVRHLENIELAFRELSRETKSRAAKKHLRSLVEAARKDLAELKALDKSMYF
ncbi:MAG: hypothetical protein C0404_09225 [Verrucomicrobia bacterium]|nr:hypothetical protein [Verrucomicrobiota bacterium]